MSDEKLTPSTEGGTDNGDPKAPVKNDDRDGYVKFRAKRMLEKATPELIARGRQELLEELGIDPEDTEAIEKLKKVKSRDWDREEKKWRGETEKWQQKAMHFEAKVKSREIDDTILASFGDNRVRPEYFSDVLTLLRQHFAHHDDAVAIVDEKGNALDTTGEKFVGGWLAKRPHFLAPTAPEGGSGSKPSNPKGDGGKKKISEMAYEDRKASFVAAMESMKG